MYAKRSYFQKLKFKKSDNRIEYCNSKYKVNIQRYNKSKFAVLGNKNHIL